MLVKSNGWYMVEADHLWEIEDMVRRLLRTNVPCLVEAREEHKVDDFFSKYTLAVPPEHKYDLIQVHMSVCLRA